MLVTGTAGAGKSTTLACMVDRLNNERDGHIVTMEDPIEYVHQHRRCIVTQREVPTDVATYSEALRSALREGGEEAVYNCFLEALNLKPDEHHDKVGTERNMSQIGG